MLHSYVMLGFHILPISSWIVSTAN